MNIFQKIFKKKEKSTNLHSVSSIHKHQLETEILQENNSSLQKLTTNSKLKGNQKCRAQGAESFEFMIEASLLGEKMLELRKSMETEEKLEVDFGFLVGVFEGAEEFQDLIYEECFKVRVGPKEEVNSLTAIREGSLDSLLICIKPDNFNYLYDILHSRQRLIFVMKEWKDVQFCIHNIEKILLEKSGQRPFKAYQSRLLADLTYLDGLFFLSFQNDTEFWIYFQSLVKDKLSGLFNPAQLEFLGNMMTLEEYYQLKNSVEVQPALRKQLELYKTAVNAEMEELKKRKAIEEINLLLAMEKQKSNEEQVEIDQTSESDDADLEAEYFSKLESLNEKKESQIETRETCSKVQNSDLYYFIQEHESSQSSEDREIVGRHSNKEPSEIVAAVPKLTRTKSCNALKQQVQQELDQEFFTKY